VVAVGGWRLGTHARKRTEAMTALRTASSAESMRRSTQRETGNRNVCCGLKVGARRRRDRSMERSLTGLLRRHLSFDLFVQLRRTLLGKNPLLRCKNFSQFFPLLSGISI